jgi:protein SCO1/2
MTRTPSWWVLALLLGAASSSATASEYRRSVAPYRVPDVTLVNQDGVRVRLQELLPPGKPAFVQFVFTSCPTVCPILGAIFSSFQTRLGPGAEAIRFVSVSIDPEHDDPAKMKAFLSRYHAGDNWTFLSGSRADIQAVQNAFDAYADNKMSHSPLTFFFSPADQAWVRIHGFIGAAELVTEYQGVQRP